MWEAWVCQFGRCTRVGYAWTCPWGHGCFFFFFFFQIQPYSVQHKTRIGPIWAEILVKKKLYNIRSKHTVLLADFKGKSLKSSQFSLDLSVSSLSLTQGSSSPWDSLHLSFASLTHSSLPPSLLWLSWTLIFYLVLVSNFRSCILISEHHVIVMYSVFTLLSTISLKLVYVYHYMKKKCLAIYRKYK